ncbi:NADH-dependent [FeFe] hydrogenase, group A6 [Clostridiaceae bacterium M8S5]|nr:NADH-dependent [FeFe] hydrogenase, group A6 [Clostridiaceae bacterium M8S5]
MSKINLTIDNKTVSVDDGTTILDAAKMVNVKIPTLCFHPDQHIKGSCRVCVVEVEGQNTLAASCCTPVREGMVIKTNTKKVRDARRAIVEMIISNHNAECLACVRNGNCELQQLCNELNIREYKLEKTVEYLPIDSSNPSIVRDLSKCIKCGRCVEVCHEVQGIGAIDNVHRSSDMRIDTPFSLGLADTKCVYCGQCINVCPVGALYEKSDINTVWRALDDNSKHVVVQIAPAVRVALGEDFGLPPGSIVTGKIVTALRHLGFDAVFDTNFTADLTIMEEGNELLHRIQNNGKLPMLTSCSPGWINFVEQFYPEFLDNVSTCKSPQQMFGALAKTYYPKKIGIDPKDVYVVSIMPCTAKKAEAGRKEMADSGYQDVDVVLTTRELAKMIKEVGLDINTLVEDNFDDPLGISTGAAVIFGASGGVMEAALRTVYEVVTGEELENIEFKGVRGLKGIKKATVKVGDLDVKVAVANSLASAREILELVKSGKEDFHFIEIMCCPGGCIGGGGQPIPITNEIRENRIKGIYQIDGNSEIRKSHKNPAVAVLYEEFLEKPLSHVSHELLHTHYTDRS